MSELSAQRPLRIAVDLTPLLPGGQNGGVKPFIFEYIRWIGRHGRVPIRFSFLTRRSSHADVRSLARYSDELICLIDDHAGEMPGRRDNSPCEWSWYDAPPDIVARLSADLLYCPFSLCTWSHPGIPVVATVVDILHRDYPFTLPPPEVERREAIFREMVCVADRIQCISNYTMTRMAHHYGFSRDRMFCSPIAIHRRLLKEGPQARGPSGRPYFLYPANAWKHKNHEVLILSYGIYRSQAGAAAWELVLTGNDDEAMQSVRALAASLGLEKSVRFLGYLSEQCYSKVWREAGALVFPSLHEGFGIPLVEAMAFSLPIVSSHIGALSEVGGNACLYVDATKPLDLAMTMGQIAGDATLREELRRRGYAQLETFSFEKDAAHFLDQLVECASQPARLSCKGIHADGWVSHQAAVSTPNWRRPARLELELHPMPMERQLEVYQGANLIGHTRIPTGSASRLHFSLWPDTRAVNLRVPDAFCLSETDRRIHGVRISSLCLRDDKGTEANLLAP